MLVLTSELSEILFSVMSHLVLPYIQESPSLYTLDKAEHNKDNMWLFNFTVHVLKKG